MTKTADSVKLTALDLKKAIADRYEYPEWLVESEVTLGGRRLDVVAFNLWTSRQNRVVGFEIKVDRGDWLRELAAFEKSEQWNEVVDTFYVVTPPKLVKADELPAGWGLLELTGNRMMTRAHAHTKPAGHTLPRELTARMLSRMAERSRSADRRAEFEASHELRQRIEDEFKRRTDRERADDKTRIADLERRLKEIHEAFGIHGAQWLTHTLAVRAAGKLAMADFEGAHRLLLNTARTQAESLREKLGVLDTLLTEFSHPAEV